MKPTHTLSILNKSTQGKVIAGAGWYDPKDGSMSIKINPCIVLNDNEDLAIKLFPIKEGGYRGSQATETPEKEYNIPPAFANSKADPIFNEGETNPPTESKKKYRTKF